MKSCRVIKRKYAKHKEIYVIQQRHPVLFWKWVDAYKRIPITIPNAFLTLPEALKQLPHFQEKPIKEHIVKDITIIKERKKHINL